MLKQCFWERFWTILKVSKFFQFWFFPSFDHPRCPGQFFLPKKIPRSMLKTCLNTFGNVFMHFEKKESFSSFLKFFQVWTFQGALGIFFLRKLSQNKFETCLDTLKNVFGHFWDFKIFSFFRIFTSCDLLVALGKKNSRNYLKQVGTLWIRFLRILTIWSFFDFWIFFESPGCTGLSFFRRKNQSKHSQTMIFGNVFGQFWKFRSFSFFQSFFQTSTLQGALAIFFLKEITSKHVQNMLGHHWEQFWTF